jgi:hypothetical protein
VECSEVNLGDSELITTPVLSNKDRTFHAYASVTLRRDKSDEEAKACTATFKLFVREGDGSFRVAKSFSEKQEFIVSVQVVGFSSDRSKLAADFLWAAGDYTGHRPVVYDLKTRSVLFRKLGSAILGQMPSCDYFEEFVGVTNSGMAIIHVPKSIYVDEGCPDQRYWHFDLRTGKAIRIKR